jgi:hypothetical protein
MGLFQLLDHLINFVLPALAIGLVMAGPARAWLIPADRRPGFWPCWAAQGLLGVAVLLSGLMLFGRDGKVATYAALVLAAATLQWLMGRSWRG